MSAVDDYAAIARALRDRHEHTALPKPVARQAVNQQAVQAIGQRGCWLCDDVGWISVKRGKFWVGLHCPQCDNPAHRPNPLP